MRTHQYTFMCDLCGKKESASAAPLPAGWTSLSLERSTGGLPPNQNPYDSDGKLTNNDLCQACGNSIYNAVNQIVKARKDREQCLTR